MRFAYHAGVCDPAHYAPLALAVEERGFDAFSFPDSICYPEEATSEYPYNGGAGRDFLEGLPFVEPLTAISHLAAITKRITFSTSVYKLPIRHPVLVAKQASTVQVLSNNRLVLGVGLSPWKEDFDICGERWEKRGTRMSEMIKIMRGLWTGEYYEHDSQFYQIPSHKICPVPEKPIPILIGGHSKIALKRAARIGDGWISAGSSFEELEAMINTINTHREEFGTIDKPFQIHAIGKDAYSVDGIKRLESLGVTEVIVSFRDIYKKQPDPSLEEKLGMIDWYKNTIIDRL